MNTRMIIIILVKKILSLKSLQFKYEDKRNTISPPRNGSFSVCRRF